MNCGIQSLYYHLYHYDDSDPTQFNQAFQGISESEGSKIEEMISFFTENEQQDSLSSVSRHSNASFSLTVNQVNKQVNLHSYNKQNKIWILPDQPNRISIEKGSIISLPFFVMNVEGIVNRQITQINTYQRLVPYHGQAICRICFQHQINRHNNPLLNFCQCKGSVKFVHLQCLRYWLAPRVQCKTGTQISFFRFEKTCCELCKTAIPLFIKKQKQSYCIIDYTMDHQSNEDLQFEWELDYDEAGLQVVESSYAKRDFGMKILFSIERDEESEYLQLIVVNAWNKITEIRHSYEPYSIALSVFVEHHRVFLLSSSQHRNIFMLMKPYKQFSFSGRNGVILRLSNNVLLMLRNKPWMILSCLQSDHTYRLIYSKDYQSEKQLVT